MRAFVAVTVEELIWGSPLEDFPLVFPTNATAAYDVIVGADLLYNPSLYPMLLPTVLRLLGVPLSADDAESGTAKQLGSDKAVVYMSYMERGGEEAFFASARSHGVICDRVEWLPSLAALGEELGCVVVQMKGSNHS